MNLLKIATLALALSLLGCVNQKKSTHADTNPNQAAITAQSLAKLDFRGAYTLKDAKYGTQTTVVLKGDKRIMTTNGLPNHETGDFPNPGNPNTISAQNLTYTFPLAPVNTGKVKWAREPGVALNGVKFEPETAESFVCETGERYRIEAFQSLVDLGLDDSHAHVQPTGAYHYHGVPSGLVELLDKGEDMILVGFAKDGFPMYYSKSGAFAPSYRLATKSRTGDACNYSNPKETINKELNNTLPDGTFVSDWEYVAGLGNLDECNGTVVNGNYAYFVTDTYPYVGRCLMGVFTEERPQGPPPGGRPPGDRPQGPPPGGRPPGGK